MKVTKIVKSVKYSLGAVNCLFLVMPVSNSFQPALDQRADLISSNSNMKRRPVACSGLTSDLTGILLLLAGVTVLVRYQDYEELITKQFFATPTLSIATGVIIIVVSVLGFYAAISQQFYFIAGYSILLIVVLILEITICALAFGLYNDAAATIRPTMMQSLLQYSNRIQVARMWDELQMGFQCCGVAGRNDWGLDRIPVSCCHIDYGTISPFECNSLTAHANGCAGELGAWLSNNAFSLAVISVIVICLQVLIMAASGWLTWKSKFDEVELES